MIHKLKFRGRKTKFKQVIGSVVPPNAYFIHNFNNELVEDLIANGAMFFDSTCSGELLSEHPQRIYFTIVDNFKGGKP